MAITSIEWGATYHSGGSVTRGRTTRASAGPRQTQVWESRSSQPPGRYVRADAYTARPHMEDALMLLPPDIFARSVFTLDERSQ